MKPFLAAAAAFVVSYASAGAAPKLEPSAPMPSSVPPLAIVIHGGAGALAPGKYTAAEEAEYRAKLAEALDAGYAVLESGGVALDAVEAAIVLLEDSPLFNAGKGAVFTREGENELDASIMDGASGKAGAVAGVRRAKNPIRLARAVMEKSEHVMMAGAGADRFAREQGLELADPSYFRTERRWKDYQEKLKTLKTDAGAPPEKYGTVGAVALDSKGNLAAGTSTGGMLMKRYGRIGDSPIIGAGAYANRACAVSGTGWGEYFIRLTVARDICAQVEYAGKPIEAAADDVIHKRLQESGGDGGVIVLGADGSYAMPFNSAGMFRGVKRRGEEATTAIYKE
jgi:beta-aspartyl-peptidase (threonine type)